MPDLFNARGQLKTAYGNYTIYRLDALEKAGLGNLSRLPYSIRVLLEALLRQVNDREITLQDLTNLAAWEARAPARPSVPFIPGRVVMQDLTGVPAVVDLAALRSAMARLGGDPKKINPLVPVDLVIDHSVQVDFFAVPDALARNAEVEFERNRERYQFLRWGQKTFDNFRVVPPATGIVHQVNLEYLAEVVMRLDQDGEALLFPDTLVGTDSHTTMINGLGVVGWGVGGIEAEAAMLGQPIDFVAPDVVGFKLTGKLREGVTPTDLTLTITQILRKKGVVEKFVEFFGDGLSNLPLQDRAMIANMAPEYGATIGFFPIDGETLRYLRLTGRSEEVVTRVDAYCKEQGLFLTAESPVPDYTSVVELDLSTVEPSLAGPKRPQDRVLLSEMKQAFRSALTAPLKERGYELSGQQVGRKTMIGENGGKIEMGHGSVVIASITSCTNTSNPKVLVAAGLLAKKAVDRGLKRKPFVKTSLAPGSRVVTEFLGEAGLLEPLGELGFNVVGYGCMTCIGNSGPLPADVAQAVSGADLVAAAVLSGNRNFEGRVHPLVRANYLASPPLVVAYAIAGTVDIDLYHEPIGDDCSGNPVYLKDIWPGNDEIQDTIDRVVLPEMYKEKYADVFSGNSHWNAIESGEGELYAWDEASTYIQEPPFFVGLSQAPVGTRPVSGARALALFGDSITTDHISPAGSISQTSPAGQFLIARGVSPRDFNSYGARRGNDRVMTRGTFANIRIKNQMVPGIEGGFTLHLPDGEQMSIYEAAMKYRSEGVPLIIIAGKEYGTGSSRDWAAKGTNLLGVKAVLAESFERIHRSNLVQMGVLPLVFRPGENAASLGLTGREVFTFGGLTNDLQPRSEITVHAGCEDGSSQTFNVIVRIDTAIEMEYYRNGGILQTVLRHMVSS